MTAPKVIHISDTETMDLHDWCYQQAEHFTKLHVKIPLFYTTQGILDLIAHCTGDGVLNKVLIEEEISVAKHIAQLLAKSAEIEASKHYMPGEEGLLRAAEELPGGIVPEPDLIPGEIEELEAPRLIPEPEETVETVEEAESATEPVEAQEKPVSKIQEAYDLAVSIQKSSKEAMRKRLDQPNSQEIAIVEAAKGARLDNSYSDLREVFDMDDQMLSVRIKEGAIVTPADLGKLAGFGFDLGRRAVWLLAESFNRLMVMGHESSVIQIASEFGMSGSYTYNLIRAAQRVPENLRTGVLPTVCVELANARYSKDEKENLAVVEEMVQQARDGKWSCAEARSQKQMKLGQEEPLEGKETLREKCQRLEAALGDILKIEEGMGHTDFDEFGQAKDICRKALGIIDPNALAPIVQPA